MKTKLVILLLGAAIAVAPALAQREVNSANARSAPEGNEDTAPRIEPLAAQAMYNFAGCVIKATRPGAVKLLAKDFRTKEYQQDIRRLAKGHDRCAANSKIGFSGLVFAGNLAEHLLSDKFTAAALSADLGVDRSTTPITARSTLEEISMCIVMRAPFESAALFRTEVMSDKEKEAMKALSPYLSACIQQGTQFRTNRIGLRALLALAAYRVAVTSKEGAAA